MRCCRGYNNGFRNDSFRSSKRSIGLGGNIGKSLDTIRDNDPPSRMQVSVSPVSSCVSTNIGQAASEDSGNGSLMRLAPVAIAFCNSPVEHALDVCAESSRTTHPVSAFLVFDFDKRSQKPQGGVWCSCLCYSTVACGAHICATPRWRVVLMSVLL